MPHFPAQHRIDPVATQELVPVVKVTNADLKEQQDSILTKLTALETRLTAIELEAKVAKWVLRLLGAVFGSIVTYLIAHWKGK